MMAYANDKKDWANFGKYYGLYYKTAYSRSKFHINNISWPIVENISDPEILEVAAHAMRYNLDNYDKNEPDAHDTYANLLYKLGQKEEAIKWEQKAALLSNNRKEIVETLDKMKRGEVIYK